MTTTATKIKQGIEPIPGYKIIKKLGAGGYGEVWSAEAPGGMEKAVKFVFGSHDSERGARELRSLNRIKSVNHPFLLSLERFEIVGSQLIIVTELASGSLEDVYDKHRGRGSCGIPKQDLLGYMHDAADGLDYLHDEFQLQHLDVKPGNLLIVGGHVKVGDFGLLKDLQEVDCSMVGGLTPIYAAPEVFDGRPHMNSDQYSLAIMYQELLTGHRPFAGRTIAQLATQHIHSAPNLEALPASDRPVIARALEKDPTRRFANCRELISRLKRNTARPVNIPRQDSPIDGTTQSIAPGEEIVPQQKRPAVDNLPSVKSQDAVAIQTSQALVIGLGGIGRKVMQSLCKKQSLAFENECDLRGLLIDTSDAELYAFREFELENNLLCNVQRACFPLKSPHDYRDSGNDRFSTISRRWIYNVPKTRKTEGLRPLGRLALVDHASHLKKMLSDAIDGLTSDNEKSLAPRVYIAGSLLGGTGSGMFIDVAFMLRSLLDERNLADVSVRPLLLASVPETASESQALSIASTHAALSEMHYFLQPGKGYPDDVANGLTRVPAARTPLPNAYVIAPSEDQDGSELLADYLWNDAFVSSGMLELARTTDKTEPENRMQATLRSFGMAPLRVRPTIDSDGLKYRAIDHAVRRWMGDPKKANEHADRDAVAALAALAAIGVEPQHWITNQLEELVGQDSVAWQHELEQTIQSELNNRPEAEFLVAKEAVVFGRTRIQPLMAGAADAEEKSEGLPAYVQNSINKLEENVVDQIREQKLDLFQAVELMRSVARQCFAYAQQNEDAIGQLKQHSETTLHQLMNDLSSQPAMGFDSSEVTKALFDLLTADVQKSNGVYFEEIGDQAKRIERMLIAHAKSLACLHSRLSERFRPSSATPSIAEQKILPFVMQNLYSRYIKDQLCQSLTSSEPCSDRSPDMWLDELREAVGLIADEMLNDTSGAGIVSTTELQAHISASLREAYPELLRFGGRQRLLLVGEDRDQLESLKPTIEELSKTEVTIVATPGAPTMLMYEASGIPVESILGNLVGRLGADLTIAGRLMTRCDIQWAEPIDRPSTSTGSMPFSG